MSSRLQHYLFDAYESRHTSSFRRKLTRDIPIQIDDQDDNDRIHEFCNLFCTITRKNAFRLELIGNFPITQEMADLAEIYNGNHDSLHGRLLLELNTEQIDVLIDLADKIRKTSFLAPNNPGWLTISARTISSLFRFVRIIKEFNNLNQRTIFSRLASIQTVLRSIAA
jgi:hypothetical protein